MRFRLGLLAGFTLGYVLGARAGRQRYEDIRRWWSAAKRNPAVGQIVDVGQGLTDMSRTIVAGGLEKTSETIRRQS